MMQFCVDNWIKDITYGIMALKNIESSFRAHYLTQEHRHSIKKSVISLKTTLDTVLDLYSSNPMYDEKRFVLQMNGLKEEDDVAAIFPNHTHIWIARNKDGHYMGYGFIEFATQDELVAAQDKMKLQIPRVRTYIV